MDIITPDKKNLSSLLVKNSRASDYREALKLCNKIYSAGLIFKICYFYGLCLLFLIFSLLCSPLAAQKTADLNAANISVIKIISSSNNVCSSSILFKNLIISTAHFINSACTTDSCADIKIYDSAGNSLSLAGTQLKILKRASALDLALLEISDSVSAGLLIKFNRAQQDLTARSSTGSNIRILSYPACTTINLAEGKILENISSLYTKTNLSLKHGSSGGAVFDQHNNLIGIASEADDLIAALSSVISNTPFTGSRIIPLVNVEKFLELDQQALFDYQAEVLNDFYTSRVVYSEKIARLSESARFVEKVKKIALENFDLPQSKVLLAALSSYAYPLFTDSNINSDAVSFLALLTSFEKYGANKSFNKEISAEELNQLKLKFSANSAKLELIVNAYSQQNFIGADSEVIIIIIKLVLALFLSLLFGLTALLYIAFNKNFRIINKLLACILVAVLFALVLGFASKQILI